MTKENVRNILLAIIFVLILVVIALFIGRFTYSYLGAQVDDLLEGEGEVTASGDTIIFSKGNDLSINASTDNFYTGSENLTDTTNPQVRLIASNKTNNASSTYSVGFRINENTFTYSTTNNTAELILTIRDENGNVVQSSSDTLSYVTVNGVSGFDITNKTGEYNVVVEHPISTTSSTTGITHTWTFTLTFVNLSNDQSINENAILDIDVILQKDRILSTIFANNCNEKNIATLACKVATIYTIDGEDGLYYHDADLTNGAEDNSYRYAGANPNNYVCFGSDENTCPSDNLYRIIGVFNEQIKLIKWDYANSDILKTDGAYNSTNFNASNSSLYKGVKSIINRYNWNSSTNTNNWSESNLNMVNLNSNYLNYLGNEWTSLIADSKWQVGGASYGNVVSSTVKTAYNYEIANNAEYTEWIGKIGLMYVSDYGYAASPENWTINMGNLNADSNINNNWMFMGISEWTISRRSGSTDRSFFVNNTGYLNISRTNDIFSIRPVFYLNSNVSYVSGDGTQSDPYRVN